MTTHANGLPAAQGLYDPATGMFYLRNSFATGMADIAFPFGAPGDGWIPLIGDWDGDGAESAGFYQPGDASHFYLIVETRQPVQIITSLPEMLAGFDRIHELAGKEKLIVAGHDPLVADRFKVVEPGIVKIA